MPFLYQLYFLTSEMRNYLILLLNAFTYLIWQSIHFIEISSVFYLITALVQPNQEEIFVLRISTWIAERLGCTQNAAREEITAVSTSTLISIQRKKKNYIYINLKIYLLPAHHHHFIHLLTGQFGPIQAMSLANHCYHFIVGAFFKGHFSFCIYFPH